MALSSPSSSPRPAWFTWILAEDWVRISVLAPLVGVDTNSIPLHSFGPTAATLRLISPPWADFTSLIDGARQNAIAQLLSSAFGATLTPLAPVLPPSEFADFWFFVSRYVASIYIPGINLCRRRTCRVTFAPGSGFGIALHGAQRARATAAGVWGERVPISRHAVRLLKQADTSSTRSRTCASKQVQDYLVMGTIALVNSCCSSCALYIPDGDPSVIGPGNEVSDIDRLGFTYSDWRGASLLMDLPDRTPVLVVYALPEEDEEVASNASAFSTGGDCLICTFAGLSPEESASAPPTPTPLHLGRAIPPTGPSWECASPAPLPHRPPPPPLAPVVPTPLPASCGDRLPHSSPSNPRLSAGSFNARGRLTGSRFDSWMFVVLSRMFASDISVLGLSETCTKAKDLFTSDSGVYPLGLDLDGKAYRYHALSATCPATGRHSTSGAGASIIWDARIPFSDPFVDPAGRLAAITLRGPRNRHLRVISIYGYADLTGDALPARELAKLLTSQINFARKSHCKVLVLGDLNEHLRESFPRPPSRHTPANSLIARLRKANLFDSFRRCHPLLDGATLPSKSRAASSAHSRTVLTTTPSRPDYIFAPRSWFKDPALLAVVDPNFLEFSDHLAIIASFPFPLVFAATAAEVRCDQHPHSTSQLNLKELATPAGVGRYRERLLQSPLLPPLSERIADLVASDSSTDFSSLPASPLSSAMADWFSLVSSSLLKSERKQTFCSPKTFARVVEKHGAILHACSALHSHLRLTAPPTATIIELWDEVLTLLPAASIVLDPAPAPPPLVLADLATWFSSLRTAITCITKAIASSQSRLKRAHCRSAINERSCQLRDALLARGKFSATLKRIGHKRSAKLLHTQIDVGAAGGASTNPTVILKKMHDFVYDWHRTRRSGPPSLDYLAWVAALYVSSAPSFDPASPIEQEEFDATLLKMKADGCPGESGISLRLILALPATALSLLLDILNLCLKWASVPASFLIALIFLIPKKGAQTLANSRPISLLEIPLKIATRVVNTRIIRHLLDSAYFSAIQFGFLPGRSCTSAFHILLACAEHAKESASEIHVCLVDLEKAFDSLEPWSLKLSYSRAGIAPRAAKFLLALDGTGKAKVITPFGCAPEASVERGVRQGEVLSPTKFLLWIEPWLQHIAATYPHLGYSLPDGSRVLLLCFADDLAIVTHSHADMQLIFTSLCEFLLFHGVSISDSKTVYVSSSARRGPASDLSGTKFSRASRTSLPPNADIIETTAFTIPRQSSSTIITYLGGAFSLNLDWPALTKVTVNSIHAQLDRLQHRSITLTECASYASMCTQGMAGYFLQLGQFSPTTLRQLDTRLDRILRAKARLPFSASTALLHAPKDLGGYGIFTFLGLAQAACTTELLIRLNSPGLLGAVSRQRWSALKLRCPHAHLAPLLPRSTRSFLFPAYCISLCSLLGFQICDADDTIEAADTFASARALAHHLPPRLLAWASSKGYRVLSDIAVEISPNCFTLQPAEAFGASIHSALAALPIFQPAAPILATPPQARPLPGPPPGPLAPGSAWPPAPQPQFSGFRLLLSELATPPSASPLPCLYFWTDGAILPNGRAGGASITISDVPGWSLTSTTIDVENCSAPGYAPFPSSFYSRGFAADVIGHEPVSIDTAELLALLVVIEHAPLQDITVYVDPTYVTNGLLKWLNNPPTRRTVRFTNRFAWLRYRTAFNTRSAAGFHFRVIKCAAHGRDANQDPIISLGNALADFSAGRAASTLLPIRDPLPPGDLPFTLLHHGALVRGDPRKAVRRESQKKFLFHALTLPKEGIILRLADSKEVSLPLLRLTRSPLWHARQGILHLFSFTLGLQALSLRTPSKTFRSSRNPLGAFITLVPSLVTVAARTHVTIPTPPAIRNSDSDPDSDYAPDSPSAAPAPRRRRPARRDPTSFANKRPLCPLCYSADPDDHPDAWHFATSSCPPLRSGRNRLRSTAFNLLLAASSPATFMPDLISDLSEWLTDACAPLAPSFSDLSESAGQDLTAPAADSPTFTLMPASAFECIPPDWPKLTPCILLPEGRLPPPATPPPAPDPTAELPPPAEPLVLVYSGPRRPSWTSALAVEHIRSLSLLLNKHLFMGTFALSLTWASTVWELDTAAPVPPDHVNSLLELYGLLPLDAPRSAISGPWHPAFSWLGLAPPRPNDKLSALLKPLSPRFRSSFWSTLLATIIRFQSDQWHLYRSLCSQELSYRRSCANRARAGRPPPVRRPLFYRSLLHKAQFPPSSLHNSLALRFLLDFQQYEKDDFLAWIKRQHVHFSDYASIWISVLMTKLRLGPAGVASLNGSSDLASLPPLSPRSLAAPASPPPGPATAPPPADPPSPVLLLARQPVLGASPAFSRHIPLFLVELFVSRLNLWVRKWSLLSEPTILFLKPAFFAALNLEAAEPDIQAYNNKYCVKLGNILRRHEEVALLITLPDQRHILAVISRRAASISIYNASSPSGNAAIARRLVRALRIANLWPRTASSLPSRWTFLAAPLARSRQLAAVSFSGPHALLTAGCVAVQALCGTSSLPTHDVLHASRWLESLLVPSPLGLPASWPVPSPSSPNSSLLSGPSADTGRSA